MKTLGLYIHIPFCVKKCIYCDFLSFPDRFGQCEMYFKALEKEIERKSKQFKHYTVDTVFIGGGTPSSVDTLFISNISIAIKDNFKIAKDLEFTIESNPGTLTRHKCLDYMKAGINRISIGLQSADEKILKFLGRIHTYEDYADSILAAKTAGFKNINTDLIFGIPGQSLDSFKDTLHKTVSAGITHISAYSLIPEEGTPLFDMLESGKVPYPDDGIDREMYHYACEFLEKSGFEHYEISNFAVKGCESRHNLKYWEEKEYLGLGLGASSFYDGKRIKNTTDMDTYLKGKDEYIEDIKIDKETEMKEFMMLGFRKTKGPDPADFKVRYRIDMYEKYRIDLNILRGKGLIDFKLEKGKPVGFPLTEKGLDFANEIFERFV